MTDQVSDSVEPTDIQPESIPAGESEPARIPKSRLDEVIKQRETFRAELDKLKKAEEKRLQEEQEAKGEYQKLIDSLKPKAERVETLEATLQRYLEAELQAIPEDKRDIFPEGLDVTTKLEIIARGKQAGLFAPPPDSATPKPLPIPTNAGEGRRSEPGGANYGLTQEEIQAAHNAKMTLEEYASYKAKQSRR